MIGALCFVGCAPTNGPSAHEPNTRRIGPQHSALPVAVAERQASPLAQQQPAPEIDALVAQALAAGNMPGCVVAVGNRERVLFMRAYGKRALLPAAEAMTEDTIFDLASLTKPIVTASAILRLVDDGRLRLDDRAARYLPELARASTRAITIRELLLHAAGLPHVNPLRDYEHGARAALAAALAVEPEATDERGFLYSDIGYLWLGLIVERAAGEPLDAFAQHALFAPLGMSETRFQPPAELLPRIAPTELTELRGPKPVLIRGVVHDPRAYRVGGVAGHAGLFSTAADLSRFARMLLAGGALDGTRVLSETAVAELTRPARVGEASRTPGWDVRSEYSRLRGSLLSERAFGHGGHTGTSLWIDPRRELFVLLLSNRVHPDGKGNVIGLAGALADGAVRAWGAPDARCEPRAGRVLPGIDVLREQGFAPLLGKRVGLVTHLAARTADGVPTLDVLAQAPGVELGAIFGPEHGLQGRREGTIADGYDAARGVPVYSLFGPTRRPTAEMLRGLDLIAVDLVDVGTRFYTYMSTLHEVLRAASEHHLPVLVLDRPNPLGGVAMEGPLLDPGARSFVNHFPLPVRHGMTAGELAALINQEEQLGARLDVIEARGWRRELGFERTGLTWSAPSPNLASAAAALLYPAVGLLESTNLSVGRGTERAFEQLGAPWIDSAKLVSELRAALLPGVQVAPIEFTPARDRYAGELCRGVRLRVSDAVRFKPVRTGLEIARALRALHPDQFQAEQLIKLLGNAQILQGLLAGTRVAELERRWEPELERFRLRRAPLLLYPRCE